VGCSCRKYAIDGHNCWDSKGLMTVVQRLMGASLLVFKNKSDVAGCMDEAEIIEVCIQSAEYYCYAKADSATTVPQPQSYQDTYMEDHGL